MMIDVKAQARRGLARLRAATQGGPVNMPEDKPDVMGAGLGRFPVLTMRAVPVNPYKPNVKAGDFPDLSIPVTRWTPPSINPQMIIRTGRTPDPSGRPVPPGAVHTAGRSIRMPR
jgi:hypothetical protein